MQLPTSRFPSAREGLHLPTLMGWGETKQGKNKTKNKRADVQKPSSVLMWQSPSLPLHTAVPRGAGEPGAI